MEWKANRMDSNCLLATFLLHQAGHQLSKTRWSMASSTCLLDLHALIRDTPSSWKFTCSKHEVPGMKEALPSSTPIMCCCNGLWMMSAIHEDTINCGWIRCVPAVRQLSLNLAVYPSAAVQAKQGHKHHQGQGHTCQAVARRCWPCTV